MKTIIYICMLFCLFSCNKEKSVDKISIFGIVLNSNQFPIDSVKVILEETCFMCTGSLPIDTKYSDNSGSFRFELTPKKDHSYHIDFEKSGYTLKTYHSIDLEKEFQNFKITMDTIGAIKGINILF